MSSQDPAHILARKNSKRGVVEQSRTASNPGGNNTEKMEMAGAHSQKAKKQHYKTILAVEPSRQTEQGKTTDNMEKKFGRGGTLHAWLRIGGSGELLFVAYTLCRVNGFDDD